MMTRQVEEIHLVCRGGRNVKKISNKKFETGNWNINISHLKNGLTIALHNTRSEKSYMQGRYLRHRTVDGGRVAITCETLRSSLDWQGVGTGEKGYLWSDRKQRPKPESSHSLGKPTNGIPPSDKGYGIVRERKAACVYAFRFANKNIWKIGWALDVKRRLSDIRKHIPEQIFLGNWKEFSTIECVDQFCAYELERRVLGEFGNRNLRSRGEMVCASEKEFSAVWNSFSFS